MAYLTTRQKITYGLGGMAMSLPDSVFLQWIFMRYVPDSEHALVQAKVFGVLYLVARVTGALVEPLIGYWSDRFQSPSGRRLPFIRRGLIPFAIAFFLMWQPPIQSMHWLNAIYIFITMQCYLLCFPLVLTPYLALMPELTPDSGERVTLTTLQALSMMTGSILFAAMGIVLMYGGWIAVGGTVAIVMLLSMAPTALTIRERPAPTGKEREDLFRSIMALLQNRPFLYLVTSVTLFFFAFNCMLMALPFWVKIYLHKDDTMVAILMVPFLLMTLAFFTAVGPIVKRIGKRAAFLGTLISSTAIMALFTGVGCVSLASPLIQTAILIALMGLPITGFMVLPYALLADVIDHDQRRTGQRREALFFALQGTIGKIGLGFSGLAFSLLAYLGAGNTVSVLGLRCVTGLAAITSLLGFFIFLLYSLREGNEAREFQGNHT